MRALVFVMLAGCNVVFGFDDIHPAKPNVTASPGPFPFAGANTFFYIDPVTVTIGADSPGTTVFYTTDGTMPDPTSTSGTAPVTVKLTDGPTTLTYFGDGGGGSSDVQSDVYHFDPTQKTQTGYVVTDTALDGDAPIAIVAPGATVTATAHVKIWSQSDCPGCALQLVYGVGTTDQGCLFDTARDDATGPGVYPGDTLDATFTITAPMDVGVHEVKVANNEQFTCDMALQFKSLKNRPDVSRIGLLIVR